MILDGTPFRMGDAPNISDSSWNATLLEELNDEMFLRLAPAIAVLVLLMAVGVLGNVVISYIFLLKLRRNTQNLLLLSLGVFDLLSCLVGIPSEIFDMRHYYFYRSTALCKAMRFMTTFSSVASIMVLIVIAGDRYRKICKPLRLQIQVSQARVGIVFVVLGAIILSVPALVIYGQRTFPTPISGVLGHDCSVNDAFKDSSLPLAYEALLGAAFLVCTCILVSVYLRVWLETRRHLKYMRSHSLSGSIMLEGFSGSSVRRESSSDTVVERAKPSRALSTSSTARLFLKKRKRFRRNDQRRTINGELTEMKNLENLEKLLPPTEMNEGKGLHHLCDTSVNIIDLDNGAISRNGKESRTEMSTDANVNDSIPDCNNITAVATDQDDQDTRSNGSCCEGSQGVQLPTAIDEQPAETGSNDQSCCSEISDEAIISRQPYDNGENIRHLAVQPRHAPGQGNKPPENQGLVLSRTGNRLSTQSLSAVRVVKALKSTRATIIACVITIWFILSYLPHLTLVTLRTVIPDFEHHFNDSTLIAYNIFLRSYFANNVINVFVYGTMNHEFRQQMLKIWTNSKACCRKQKSESKA